MKQSLEDVLDTRQKKLAFFQNVILIAAADKYLDNGEGDLLLFICQRMAFRKHSNCKRWSR